MLYFGLIFISFACGKAKALPEAGLACCVVTLTSMMWMLQTG